MPYRFIILIAVLALNAFFAAAEVALVSVRKSRLRAMADEGQTARASRVEPFSQSSATASR